MIQEDANPNTTIGGAHDALGKENARVVDLPDVVLEIQRSLGLVGETDTGAETRSRRLGTIASPDCPGCAAISAANTCPSSVEPGSISAEETVRS